MNEPDDKIIQLALEEDIGTGDVTTDAIFGDADIKGSARIYAKEDLVVAGTDAAQKVFAKVDPELKWIANASDGKRLAKGDSIAVVKGRIISLLKAERTALNFLQRLSGIATLTARFVDAIKDSGVVLRDTRKTIPGMRALNKAATRAGGAENHRMGLYDQFFIKNNHIDTMGSIKACVEKARADNPNNLKIQVEVRNEEEAGEAVAAGADSLLMDNMRFETAEKIALRYRDKVELEVSGNVSLVTIARWARTGVHAISVGAITHSAAAVDISMEIKPL